MSLQIGSRVKLTARFIHDNGGFPSLYTPGEIAGKNEGTNKWLVHFDNGAIATIDEENLENEVVLSNANA